MSYAKRLEILALGALQTRRIKSNLYGPSLQCCSNIAVRNLLTFLFYVVLILLNSLNLSVVLMFRFQKYYSVAFRVINIWNSLSSDTVNASSISVCKHKLESVDFTPFVWWSLFRPVCFIVVLFSFVGHASVSFGTCVFTVQTFVYIN